MVTPVSKPKSSGPSTRRAIGRLYLLLLHWRVYLPDSVIEFNGILLVRLAGVARRHKHLVWRVKDDLHHMKELGLLSHLEDEGKSWVAIVLATPEDFAATRLGKTSE